MQLSIFEQPVQKYFINNLLIILIYILSCSAVVLVTSLQLPSIGNVAPNVNVLQASAFFLIAPSALYIYRYIVFDRLLKNTRLLRCATAAYGKVRLIAYEWACLAAEHF